MVEPIMVAPFQAHHRDWMITLDQTVIDHLEQPFRFGPMKSTTVSMAMTHRYRRRIVPVPVATIAAFALGMGASFLGHVSAARRLTTEPLVSIDTPTLNSNMRHWTTDYAVMFYAPWCSHCKEVFMPMWQDVATQLAKEDPRGKRKLVMGKFDCEKDMTAVSFCQDIALKYYPTFMFFGAGKFYDHDPVLGLFLERPTIHDSSVKFPSSAMVYYEAMMNWVNTMHFISGSNRAMAKFNVFGGAAKDSSEARLVAEIEALERQNHQLQEAMAGGETAGTTEEGSKLPYGYGDPYKELWEVGYGEEFDPVISCVVDMAVQYCEVEGVKEQDPWCATLESCIATDFQGDECWPSSCPFRPEGCQIASFCLTPELIETYIELLGEQTEADELETAASGNGVKDGAAGMLEGGVGVETEEQQEAGGEQAGAPLPPFLLGRRPAAPHGGVERAGDERDYRFGGEAEAS